MRRGDFSLCVVVDDEILPERPDAELECAWVNAITGKEFSLLLVNRGIRRVAVVLSIDGLSAVSGRPASLKTSPAYIVSPSSQFLVRGWRVDQRTAAAFLFDVAPKGYARQLGENTANVGIISGAFFGEARSEPCVDLPRFSLRWPSTS